MAWHGMAWHGMAWYGVCVCVSVAQHVLSFGVSVRAMLSGNGVIAGEAAAPVTRCFFCANHFAAVLEPPNHRLARRYGERANGRRALAPHTTYRRTAASLFAHAFYTPVNSIDS